MSMPALASPAPEGGGRGTARAWTRLGDDTQPGQPADATTSWAA